MAALTLLCDLKDEFDQIHKSLKNVDDEIKRITGRDPTEFRPTSRRQGASGGVNNGPDYRNRERPGGRPEGMFVGNAPSTKMFRGSVFSRMPVRPRNEPPVEEDSGGEEEEELKRKVTLQSSVVATPKEVRTRRDTLETQKKDKKVMDRNRRMFGMILGTLQKFQHEESGRMEQAQKRAEIEKKLEVAAEIEKETVKKERQALFLNRREKQAQIRRLEQKLELAEMHEDWEKRQKLLQKYIFTKVATPIAYLPAKHTAESDKRLKESQQRIQEVIEMQRKKIEGQLAEIDELYRKGGNLDEEDEMEQGEVVREVVRDKENLGPRDDGSSLVPPLALETSADENASVSRSAEGGAATVQELKEEVVRVEENEKTLDPLGDQEFEPIYD